MPPATTISIVFGDMCFLAYQGEMRPRINAPIALCKDENFYAKTFLSKTILRNYKINLLDC